MVRTTPRGIRAAAVADAGRCIAVGGHGVPDAVALKEAMKTVSAVAVAVRAITRKVGGHEFKPVEPEVHLLTPARGGRGGARWTVSARVPAFVSPRDVREAAERVAGRHRGAKGIRLVPVDAAAVPAAARPGRDRLPSHIRETRTGPQHRARELR